MSSYIIAGSADSIDTAYCEEIARRVQAKYKNIDFRVVIKHPSQWQEYLQEICRIYGFLKKSNPIIYTFDGKIIGNRQNFVKAATQYFGLDEELLIVEDLTAKINMKLAEEELQKKKVVKGGIKTLNQKIELRLKELLAKKVLKYNLKEKESFLVNGIEYIHQRVARMVEQIKFTTNLQVPLLQEEVVPEEINLQALAAQDQIKPEEGMGKEPAFVTNANEHKPPPSEVDRMSQASRTNKMHESVVSQDKDSKAVKESKDDKLRIDEEQDDIWDYVDYPQKEAVVCELADQFYVAFEPTSLIGEELFFYHNQDPNGNTFRLYNNSRPIKGHRVLIKEVYYQNQVLIEEAVSRQEILPESQQEVASEQKIASEENVAPEQKVLSAQDVTPEPPAEEPKKEEQGEEVTKPLQKQVQKSKTEPNIKMPSDQAKEKEIDEISEPHSDLNIISHMTYHTLFIHKPLSQLQLKNLLHFVSNTNTIACLRFLPQNPNPRVRLYVRKHLLREEDPDCKLPVERFISKQVQQGEFTWQQLPSQKSSLILPPSQMNETYRTMTINDMGFTHYIYKLDQHGEQQKLSRVIKHTIDHMLSIEEEVKRDIGYNLIFTKEYMMLVPLVQPYAVYNGQKLYFDGLAFLGYIHTAQLQRAYQVDQAQVGNQHAGQELRRQLAIATGLTD